MTIWWLIFILAALGSFGIAFIWLIVFINHLNTKPKKGLVASISEAAKDDVEHIFNNDFREELRNRGRLHFEKILNENAMFLQQDLRLTTSELNQYMKNEISQSLKEEFKKYEQSIADAKQIAIESLEKTNQAIKEQRALLSQQIEKQVIRSKQLLIEQFSANMVEIVNHYIMDAIGDQIDLNDQLDYILADLEANKAAIIEDIANGA